MKSKQKTKNIFLTGITGNLGAYAAGVFLEKGYKVTALVRAKTNLTVNAHIKKVIKSLSVWLPAEEVKNYLDSEMLVLVKAQMTDKSEMGSIKLANEFDETWHFASSLKYMPKDREEIYAANIDGLYNVLHFHERHSHENSRFIYISTAYVGGRTVLFLPEAQVSMTEDLTFKNEYEKSKLIAENIVLDYSRKKGFFSLVFRPSIVMGDTVHKKLINYTGFYLALDSLINLNEFIKNATGKIETLRFESDNDIGLNLIPVDHVIQNMININERVAATQQVFNIVNDTNIDIKNLEETIEFSHLRISVVNKEDFERRKRTRNEKLMSYGFNYILPYANNKVKFDKLNTMAHVGRIYSYAYYPGKLAEIVNDYIGRKETAIPQKTY
jgi:nucleoside-diphosphate-sugar epimerase